VSRFSPTVAALLVVVTGLLLAYGRFTWSWVAGPVAALALWSLERKSQEPAEPAPARANVRREPTPVD
jgi:hypothetical protein